MTLRVEQVVTDSEASFFLIGRITSSDVQRLKAAIAEASRPVVLDLQQVWLVDLDAAYFFAAAVRRGIELRHVPPYIREWILLEKPRVDRRESE